MAKSSLQQHNGLASKRIYRLVFCTLAQFIHFLVAITLISHQKYCQSIHHFIGYWELVIEIVVSTAQLKKLSPPTFSARYVHFTSHHLYHISPIVGPHVQGHTFFPQKPDNLSILSAPSEAWRLMQSPIGLSLGQPWFLWTI